MKRAIAEYMKAEPDDSLVSQVIEAAGGASADDIRGHFKTLCLTGHKPGRAKGPRSFGWFVAVTRQYFADLHAMEEARHNPTSSAHWSQLDSAARNRMTARVELPDGTE